MNSLEEQEAATTKEKTVTEIIVEVIEEMCDGYCKFPQAYTPDEWEKVIEEVCAGCPLNRL